MVQDLWIINEAVVPPHLTVHNPYVILGEIPPSAKWLTVLDLKKIRDTKGIFHAKMDPIKDRNGMDLTEAEDIKRGGKNTQKNSTKKIFISQITMMV